MCNQRRNKFFLPGKIPYVHHDRVKLLNYSIRTNNTILVRNRDVAKPLSACLSQLFFYTHKTLSIVLMINTISSCATLSLARVLVVLLLGFQPLVWSFSISPSPIKETARALTQLYMDQAIDAYESSDFWGKPRSKDEIVGFVSDAVFGDFHEALEDNSHAKAKEQCQWVEVISAEPPVRRSDFSRFSKFILVLSLLGNTCVSYWLCTDFWNTLTAIKSSMLRSVHRLTPVQSASIN